MEQEYGRVIAEIVAERRRQIGEEGWTPEHDDEHVDGAMARAAACYADHAGTKWAPHHWRGRDDIEIAALRVPPRWPWSNSWWKPRGARSNLVRAAALIVAEIERLDRASPPREIAEFRSEDKETPDAP